MANKALIESGTPTALDDATATRLGLKSYSHGTTYNGGNAPTVTLASGGGSLNSVGRSMFVPYQLADGSWRLKFNLCVSVSSLTRTNCQFAINGLTFNSTGSAYQAIAVNDTSLNGLSGYCSPGTGTLVAVHQSLNTSFYGLSGDVELQSKPTWAY